MLASHIQRLIDINKKMMETLHHQLSVQSAILQQLIRVGTNITGGFLSIEKSQANLSSPSSLSNASIYND